MRETFKLADKTNLKRFKWVVEIINVCQLLNMYFRVFRGFSTLTWKHIVIFTPRRHCSLCSISTVAHFFCLKPPISQGEPLLVALFPKFTSPRALLITTPTPQFRTCPTVWWRRCAIWGGFATKAHNLELDPEDTFSRCNDATTVTTALQKSPHLCHTSVMMMAMTTILTLFIPRMDG